MAPPVTLVSKLKVQLKMAIQRLRMLQQKSTAIAKQQRRAMAELLAAHKLESARIRVENIIRSDISTELHEILELYCELLLARIGLLEGPVTVAGTAVGGDASETLDTGLDEAVRSILYAAPRCDIKELSTARALLVDKFGKEYALLAAEGQGVPERVVKRVRVETPKLELVDAYLREIGRTYGVRFPGDPDTEDEIEEDEEAADKADDDDDDQDGDGGGIAEPADDSSKGIRRLDPPLRQDLARATPPRDMGESRSPLSIAPPSPTTENPKPSVRLPSELKTDKSAPGTAAAPVAKKTSQQSNSSSSSTVKKTPAAATPAATSSTKAKDKSSAGGGSGPGGTVPNVDELAKRFAALKRG